MACNSTSDSFEFCATFGGCTTSSPTSASSPCTPPCGRSTERLEQRLLTYCPTQAMKGKTNMEMIVSLKNNSAASTKGVHRFIKCPTTGMSTTNNHKSARTQNAKRAAHICSSPFAAKRAESNAVKLRITKVTRGMIRPTKSSSKDTPIITTTPNAMMCAFWLGNASANDWHDPATQEMPLFTAVVNFEQSPPSEFSDLGTWSACDEWYHKAL
mmetsp:Transcript_33669/g.92982  ORF Transcript_33669/g.92982 Transcript_33669/m.92982 type:complete len:213 (-) Transcript_33669:101-739(-)